MKLTESERNKLMQTLDDVMDLLTEADFLLGSLGVSHYNQSKELTAAAFTLDTVMDTLYQVAKSVNADDENQNLEYL